MFLSQTIQRVKDYAQRLAQSQPVCPVCFSDPSDGLSLIELFQKEDLLCGYCRKLLTPLKREVSVLDFSVYALYLYDEQFEQWIYQVKEAKDVTLAPVFLHPYVSLLKKRIAGKTVVMVPSSAKKTKQRGFEVLPTLYQGLGVELNCPFEKDDVKQSQRNASQRSRIKNHIRLIDKRRILDKDVVLIDDVCTTGQTLKACLDLIKPYVKTVSVVVLAMHPDNLNSSSSVKKR